MTAQPSGPGIHDLQAVQERRRAGPPAAPVVTLTARVSLAGLANVRVTARPVVGAIADALAPRLEIHAEGGSSIVIEGAPLAELVGDSLNFLKDKRAGAERQHDYTFGLTVSFDLATGPFTTLEPPPFLVAQARTVLHESGAAALRIVGEDRALVRSAEHAPVKPDERVTNTAFELQVASRDVQALRNLLQSILDDLAPDKGMASLR
ncbi:MAG TPA: hypothetical protein VNZ52_09815 [Candidatus Thermoplasmatota archaeon]|nr:hypothetical protein [Candidatus Thermoplasmatota archaeon]